MQLTPIHLDLSKLAAGPDFAEFLTANGWTIVDGQVGTYADYLVFAKYVSTLYAGQVAQVRQKLEYKCDLHKSTMRLYQERQPNTDRYMLLNVVENMPEIELFEFACLCFGMQWVTLREANLNCQAATGHTLADMLAEAFAGVQRQATNQFHRLAASVAAEA